MTRKIYASWSRIIHLVHCCLLFLIMCTAGFIYLRFSNTDAYNLNMLAAYGCWGSVLIVVLYFAPITPLIVMSTFNFVGLVIYNCFHNDVKLRTPVDKTPFICFRVVTRGNYPELVKDNVARNRNLCLQMGLQQFEIQIVTDSEIPKLPGDRFVRQTVVPKTYATKRRSLYKARALQYALEADIDTLANNDWIVHLDEESLLTPNSVKGILNFVSDGQYPLGQGMITYANENVVNWMTTLMDAFRVADDLGKLKFQMKFLHRLVIDWKGSFLVCRAGVEKSISFDNGPEGSIIEDIYFGQKAAAMGYRFNYVEGEVWEKSPFTLVDFAKQRKRWLEGGRLIIYSTQLSYRTRVIFGWIRVGSFLFQTGIYYALCTKYVPLSCGLHQAFELSINLCMVLFVYMHVLGAVKSYTLYTQNGLKKLLLGLLAFPVIIIVHGFIYTVVFIATMFTRRTSYEIVNKNTKPALLEV